MEWKDGNYQKQLIFSHLEITLPINTNKRRLLKMETYLLMTFIIAVCKFLVQTKAIDLVFEDFDPTFSQSPMDFKV